MAIINIATLTYVGGILFLLCAAVYAFFKYHYRYWFKLGLPFVKPEFIWGSIGEGVRLQKHLVDEFLDWYKEYKQKGHKFFGIYFFYKPVLVILDPSLIKTILVKDFDHFVDRGAYCDEENDPLTAHLITLSGLKWKRMRQKLSPTFTSGKLKMMFQTLIDCTEELQNCLDEYISTAEPVDIKKILSQYTTDVIGSCAFGIKCNSFKNPDSEFIRYGSVIFKPNIPDRIKMFLAILFPSVIKFFKIRTINKDVDYFFRKLVKDTIEYRENNNITRNDFLQLLIELKNKGWVEADDDNEPIDKSEVIGTKLTINEAAAQTFLFFIAGYDTSSTAMAFCLYELAQNHVIQDKVREEIVHVLKQHDGKLTYQAIVDMHYLERTILETLRKHTPLGLLQREVTEEYTIPDTEITLEKNLGIFIPVTSIHMDPEYYPDPEKFDPDRFTEENKAMRPDFTYLPFGDGPRFCLGMRFAVMQVKVGISRLLLSYKFKLNSKTHSPLVLEPSNFIRSAKDGIWLDAEKITV